MAEEWDKFQLDAASESELTTVRHISHLADARRILEDGRIKAGLIYDESRLNQSRIGVAWVSANTWGDGSIYGTVEFEFAWADILAGRQIYWVEAMNDYQPPAYRFLLSRRSFASTAIIKPYDPDRDAGPLQRRHGRYYWNRSYTSEFMIEDDLPLDKCTQIGFVMHHQRYCSSLGSECPDLKLQPQVHRSGGAILAFLVGHGIHVVDGLLKPMNGTGYSSLDIAYEGLVGFQGLAGSSAFGGVITDAEQCERIVLGSLLLFGSGRVKESRALLDLIGSADMFDAALLAVVRAHFNDPNWSPFDPFK